MMKKNWSSRKVVIAPRHITNLEKIAQENQFESLSETIDWVLTDWHRWINGFNQKYQQNITSDALNTAEENTSNDTEYDPLEGL
ncbi:MAG: hypothetical protein F6K08_15880 [Okeania sp. SIO1H6]|nr:hypothetical protein [Okeania sp. SIO1H6]